MRFLFARVPQSPPMPTRATPTAAHGPPFAPAPSKAHKPEVNRGSQRGGAPPSKKKARVVIGLDHNEVLEFDPELPVSSLRRGAMAAPALAPSLPALPPEPMRRRSALKQLVEKMHLVSIWHRTFVWPNGVIFRANKGYRVDAVAEGTIDFPNGRVSPATVAEDRIHFFFDGAHQEPMQLRLSKTARH